VAVLGQGIVIPELGEQEQLVKDMLEVQVLILLTTLQAVVEDQEP
jgi:hypothetical protein